MQYCHPFLIAHSHCHITVIFTLIRYIDITLLTLPTFKPGNAFMPIFNTYKMTTNDLHNTHKQLFLTYLQISVDKCNNACYIVIVVSINSLN